MTQLLERAQRRQEAAAQLVNTEYRPAFHLCAPIGWLNDPNGFGIYGGRYHLFYQYHPYAPVWGPMHWGHWSSEDLVHWKVEPVALAPDQPYDAQGCFSGTSLEVDGRLYLMYTGVSKADPDGPCVQQQCLAVSRDGIHFEKYPGNPVISSGMLPQGASPQDFRDPKLFRDGEGFHLIAASRGRKGGQLLRYSSPDMLHWRYDGVFLENLGDMAECPDVFVQQGQTVVVTCLMHADARRYGCGQPVVYAAGKTEGAAFRAGYPFRNVDQGMDFYAPQSLNLRDGRQVMIGWAFTWEHRWPVQARQWAGMMTLPRVCHLEGGRLMQKPLEELASLRQGEGKRVPPCALGQEARQLHDCAGPHKELRLTVRLTGNARMRLALMESPGEHVLVTYDGESQRLQLDTSASGYSLGEAQAESCWQQCQAQVPLQDGQLRLHIFVDASILEMYVNEGQTVMTALAFPRKKEYGVSLAVDGEGELTYGESWDMQSIMED